ncbi:MAG TPA: putative Ig domain-containing protein, partial [Verrucomicrobiae bacterium]|nr:putative Ig domain-containing protein [Verrucomicrobiae bacterium]
IPGDEDGATNGQISVSLRLGDLPEANRLIGSYVFRVSALDGSFTAVVKPFVVVQSSAGQTIRGTVTANGSPLPGAAVAALVPEGDGANFRAGVIADGAGEFVLNLPPGDYGLLGFKPGFVASFDSMPQVSLGSGAVVTQGVVLASAARTISGRVIDGVSSNGIAGLQLFAESSSGEVALAHTDTAGNFVIGAGVGEWKVSMADQGLRLLGYSGEKYTFDTTGGDVSGALIQLSKGRGTLELVFFFPNGSFGNGTNGLMAFPTQLNYYYALFNLKDVNFPTNVLFSGPSGSGLANTASANFGANYGGDSAFYSSPQISVPSFPPGGLYTVNYKNQPLEFMLADPQAQSHQVLLVPRVRLDGQEQIQEIQWERRDVNGASVGSAPFMRNIQIRIDGMGGRLYDAELGPDETSHMPFSPVSWTNVSSIQMVYDDNAGNQYVCFWDRGVQPLQILTGTNLPSATVGSFYQNLFVAAGGLTPYTWSMQSGSLPTGLNLGGTGELSGNALQTGTYNFSVRVTDSNQQFLEQAFTLQVGGGGNARLEPKMRSAGRFELRVSGAQAGQSYTVQYSTDLRNWFPLVTTNAPGAWFDVVDTGANDAARYYRVSHP